MPAVKAKHLPLIVIILQRILVQMREMVAIHIALSEDLPVRI
jgi:hypothetical protein